MRPYLWLAAFLATTFFLACKSDKKCKYKPAPIFEAGLPHVKQYNYEVQGQESLESLLLDTGVLLEIGQRVCESSQQEYRFIVRGDRTQYPDSIWLREAARQFVFLSTFSPKQAALKSWADVIEASRQDMRLGEEKMVQPGVYLRIDRVANPDESTLQVLLGMRDEG